MVNSNNPIKGALEDLTVIDLTHYIAGPFCTKLFADFGADVIKVERPGTGDGARRLGPFPDDRPDPERSGIFLYLNTNKKSLTLNLKTGTGQHILMELVESADILVENFRPGVMECLGLGWETLHSTNPELVMTSISNFGQSGPYRDYKASDLIHYGLAGFSWINGTSDREPLKGPPSQSQYHAGILAFLATMGGIMARELTGEGQYLDVSILESVCAVLQPYLLKASLAEIPASRDSTRPPGHPLDFFEVKDGHIYIAATYELAWNSLLEMLNIDSEVRSDPRFRTGVSRFLNRQAVNDLLRPRLMAQEREKFFRDITDLGIMAGIPFDIGELFKSEHLKERSFFVEASHDRAGRIEYPGAPFKLQETPWGIRNPAPLLGQHNYEILQGRLGYTKSQIINLRQISII